MCTKMRFAAFVQSVWQEETSRHKADRSKVNPTLDKSKSCSSHTDFWPILAHEPNNFLLKHTEVDWPEMFLCNDS